MGNIIVLPTELKNKIAAGEVIERPASILKELIENALDAGASDISVELTRGGCGIIKVQDNGTGIEQQEVALAFSRYATSKIYAFEDIYHVRSFGFRGEALPSIASVSRVEMITKKHEAAVGVKIVVENGKIEEITETGSPSGTTIVVSRIFDSVPVRKKFLKSENVEQGHCIDVITRLALVHPTVRFTAMANDREVLLLPAVKSDAERLALLLGEQFRDEMNPVSGERQGIRLYGFISRPFLTRSNAKQMYSFVNKRFIRDYLVNHAVMTAYRSIIEARRYPVAVIMLELPPQEVDVNVHPAKLEVRFRQPRDVYDVIVSALSKSLGGAPSANVGDRNEYGLALGGSKTPSYDRRVEQVLRRYTLSARVPRLNFPAYEHPTIVSPPKDAVSYIEQPYREENRTEVIFSNLRYMGQLDETYLLFAGGDGLLILDQHAAHERIIFERLKGHRVDKEHESTSQRLLIPEIMNLSARDFTVINECLPILDQCGFDIEAFGDNSVIIKASPSLLSSLDIKRIIADFVEEFSEKGKASLDGVNERIYTFLACKSAVKANHYLTEQEVRALCTALDNTLSSSSCPHGRPVFISFPSSALEKMFKRR